ncbi:MAG: glycosyl hydrolase family 18 protein [Silvibacterium sp.]
MKFISLLSLFVLPLGLSHAQTVPTFKITVGQSSYTLAGSDPSQGQTTTIPTVLVPVTLSFEAKKVDGRPFVMDASSDVSRVLRSPVFSKAAFASGGHTQYADAMLRTTFPGAAGWHTLLGQPEIKPVTITIPASYGYILTSKKTGASFAVADIEYVQKQLFQQLPRQDGKLVIAVTHNTTYYTLNDDTLCCSWGTHGVDSATGNSFVLGSYLYDAPAVVKEADVQPLTQQLAEFVNNPLHDPLFHGGSATPGNAFPRWMRPASMRPGDMGSCGGSSVATSYFLLEPTDTNPKNNFPESKPFLIRAKGAAYHLQNVALLPWYTGGGSGFGSTYSFPDVHALADPAKPCSARRHRFAPPQSAIAAIPSNGAPNGHKLIGYWTGSRFTGNQPFPLRDISPQWDIILVAFASPEKGAPEGTLRFQPPYGITPEQLKSDIAYMKSRGKKVMISLGGGGEYFTLADRSSIPTFVNCVTQIVSEYGFDGVDLDFEAPSLQLDPGDTDFRNPTTPSIVNLIAALRQLHDHFGSGFMISLVPEGSQIPAGYPTYGGQFGSYLPLTYALRNILSFIDVQSYNTPPLEGLDGEIYQPNTVDYHAAMTDLLLNGFNVGGNPHQFFPPLPANKVAIGFLIGDTTPAIVSDAMSYIITGKAPAGTTYKLRKPSGYPGMMGAMFWTIDADHGGNYNYSNVIGPQLHSYPATR